MSDDPHRPAETPLESWKAIAEYLQRDARTVRRWEALEQLPVHRHRHLARSSVYAFVSELDAWRATRRPALESTAPRSLGLRVRALALLTLLTVMSSGGGRAMGPVRGVAAQEGVVVIRQAWTGPDVDLFGTPSADGRYLSYSDWETGDLALKDLVTGETRRLTAANEPGAHVFWSAISPDGRQVAYVWTSNNAPFQVRLVSTARDGKQPRILYNNPNVGYADLGGWSRDGASLLATIAGSAGRQMMLITVADGGTQVLKTFDWQQPHARLSPDGRYVAYDFPQQQDSAERDIFVLATDGSRETRIVENPGNDVVLGWAPDGRRLLITSDRTGTPSAWIVSVIDGRPVGDPEIVKPDMGNVEPMAVTANGAFYYGVRTGIQDVYTAVLDQTTGRVATTPAPVDARLIGRASSAAWSPDGHLAYLSRRSPGNEVRGRRVICIRSPQADVERELSTNLSFETAIRLQWSPDSRFLLASAMDDKGRRGLYRIDAGSGEVATIVQESPATRPQGVWTADGKAILYTLGDLAREAAADPSRFDIRQREISTGQEHVIYRASSPMQTNSLALSQDGQSLAFGVGGSTGAVALMVMPASGGAARELHRFGPKDGVAQAIEWTRDGKHLLISIGTDGSRIPGLRSELWRVPVNGGQLQRVGLTTRDRASLSVSPDGQITFTGGENKQEVWVMEHAIRPADPAR